MADSTRSKRQIAPEEILLPDKPYAFDEADRKCLSTIEGPASPDGHIHLIDGTLVSWYGPHIAEAIRVLARVFANGAEIDLRHLRVSIGCFLTQIRSFNGNFLAYLP